jgi:hypothetical protein
VNTYREYKEVKSKQDTIVDQLSDKLNSYTKGAFGMVEESVRMSKEYKTIKMQYSIEFKKLQNINSFGVKTFKKEIRKEHEEKRNQRR